MSDLRSHGTGHHSATTRTLAFVEQLYRQGQNLTLIGATTNLKDWGLDGADEAKVAMLRGMALFDAGDIVASLDSLTGLLGQDLPASHLFQATFALLLRASDFRSPEELLPTVSSLRELAARLGNADSLASLHLSVARLEGLRGRCLDAHRHLEIARHLAADQASEAMRCFLDLVEASLEAVSGNLARSERLAESTLRRANEGGFAKYRLAALTNLAVTSLYAGRSDRAKRLLDAVLPETTELTFVRFGAMDTSAQVALFDDDLGRCQSAIEQCERIASADRVPSRSWYDLAHQLTRCAYYERLDKPDRIVAIADDVDSELNHRQYKALRASLLCAKARALARLGKRQAAQACLTQAVRTCPRGAVDPLIVLEASKGTCEARGGDLTAAARHFDRALAACRAIGHHCHERWITRTREALVPARPRPAIPGLDTTEAALLLTDVATILGAGHSVDLMAMRTISLLENTPLAPRVHVDSASGCEYQANPTAAVESAPNGSFSLRLRGSDRQIAIHVDGTQTLEEMSLLKSIADITQMAVLRTVDTEYEDDQQNLWPHATAETDDDVVFRSPRMIELRKIAIRLAETDMPVFITGETGTGKEIFARLIHEHSKHRRGPFVPFNCSAVPRDLMESQLFGHRRGAFTGAADTFPGVIRAAERGTLFLDEIGDLDLASQPKLLRFLESGEVHALGDLRAQRVPVRVVAATNASIEEAMRNGLFRRDLFYRLGVGQIALPPLRERKDEIPALVTMFVSRSSRECGRANLTIGDDFVAALLLYDWPGNIRELVNEIRRVVAMASDADTLTAAMLNPAIARGWNARPTQAEGPAGRGFYVDIDQPLSHAIDLVEQQFIEHALRRTGGRVSEAANLLGISRKGLFLKRRRRGLVSANENVV